jgi:hypothetical protein
MTQALGSVMEALNSLRAPVSMNESDLHQQIAKALTARCLSFRHEHALMPRCRIDFLVNRPSAI